MEGAGRSPEDRSEDKAKLPLFLHRLRRHLPTDAVILSAVKNGRSANYKEGPFVCPTGKELGAAMRNTDTQASNLNSLPPLQSYFDTKL